MADIVNDYFKLFYPPQELRDTVEARYSDCGFTQRVDGYSNVFPAMKMADGLELSVQGHWGAYSWPRDDWAEEYLMVEIMGPPKADELLSPYERECNAVGDEMIYPSVPVHVVLRIIEKHGGLVEASPAELCSDCPPHGYPTDETRCDPCPRRTTSIEEAVNV